MIGDPQDNHCRLFAAAARPLEVEVQVLDYREAFADPSRLGTGSVVRFETPGRDPGMHAFLVELGSRLTERGPTQVELAKTLAQKGRIVHPDLWHLGLGHVLRTIREGAGPTPRFLASPQEITAMFDKCACHAKLAAAGLPVAASPGPITGFAELEAQMAAAGMPAVFVKLRHGSAASGIVALRTSRGRWRATSTVEMGEGEGRASALFNTRRLRTYSRPRDIAAIVDALCRFGVHVERWIPKLGIDGKSTDLRVLVVAGKPCFQVVRMSRGPITNLHLGGTRATPDILANRLREGVYEQAMASCVAVGRVFPEAFQYAVDLAFTSDGRKHCILEVNAFGDLLKGATANGMDTYAHQLSALRQQEGWDAR